MIEFLISLLPVSLGIWGIHILFEKDHILEKQGDWLDEKLGKWAKPVALCPICMGSAWGTIGFFAIRFFFGVDLPWRQYLPFIFCLTGLQTVISKAVSKYRIIEEFDTEAFLQLFDLNEKKATQEKKASS